jgi:GAF domain-containing protein
LARGERQQATIARLGLLALEEIEIQSFLDQAVREVQATLGTDFAKILELRPGGGELLLRAGVGWRDDVVGRGTVGSDMNSQAGFTLSSLAPVIVEDLKTERRFSGPALLLEHGVRSGISCVIGGNGEAYGVFGVHTRAVRAFGEE